ncbi:MAG TPA: BTAD domain-containing putative transcriptional regulator [Solirubrobacteraceae bacterium]|nr:BTAD domain-containing putative transcriptional regulator [Solirubrobacteraceae bacterium]
MLQLRPGLVCDRRRRADPDRLARPRLRIITLGRTSVESATMSIDGDWLDKRTGQLLRYLVVRRGRAVSADEVGEHLWRGADYSVTRTVRTCVHRLRRELEPDRGNHEAPALLVSRGGSYGLNMDLVEVDADEFERQLTTGLDVANVNPGHAAQVVEQGLGLYKGEFLADVPFAEWAMSERARLHELACHALRSLAELYRQQRLGDAARRSLDRLAVLQPLDEGLCRELIELEILQGRGTAANRRYERLRRMMTEAFGHGPQFTLAELARPQA